ncbi:MAG: rod-binding protein [Amaricoccus sp.]
MELPPLTSAAPRLQAPHDRDDIRTREAARNFEATFLAEMLQYTGLNATPQGFGGGAGEDAFGSLLTEQYAQLLAERGGIGLAERVFDILKQGNRDA